MLLRRFTDRMRLAMGLAALLALAADLGRFVLGLDDSRFGDFFLSGGDFTILLPIFGADILSHNALQRGQLGQGVIHHFRIKAVFFSVAARADSPDVHHGKPVIFNGALDFFGKIFTKT